MSITSIITKASNVKGGENPPFTFDAFYKRYPQFFEADSKPSRIKPLIPKELLNDFIQLAHSSIKKSRYKGAWELCMGLFIAHLTTLYMQTIPKAVENAAEAGAVKGLVTSKSVDGVSVSRDYSHSLGDLNGWGSWKTTTYGVQLVTMAKLYGMGGMYVP